MIASGQCTHLCLTRRHIGRVQRQPPLSTGDEALRKSDFQKQTSPAHPQGSISVTFRTNRWVRSTKIAAGHMTADGGVDPRIHRSQRSSAALSVGTNRLGRWLSYANRVLRAWFQRSKTGMGFQRELPLIGRRGVVNVSQFTHQRCNECAIAGIRIGSRSSFQLVRCDG